MTEKPTAIDPEINTNFVSFGEALGHYRENYYERVIKPVNPDIPHMSIRALALIAAMVGNSQIKAEILQQKPKSPFIVKDEVRDGKTVQITYYSISSGAYSEIESGTMKDGKRVYSFPEEPGPFLQAYARVLAIAEGSPEWKTLIYHLAKSTLKKRMGDLAEDVLDKRDFWELYQRLTPTRRAAGQSDPTQP